MAGDHKCPVCQATFTRPQHVARHMRSHTGDRPYKCQHCGDQFARSDLLSRHVNKCHAGDKPPTTTAPTRRKGQHGSYSTRATTSKQACDQCVISTLPCDGANPCSKCVQRKMACTYVKFQRQTAPVGPGHKHSGSLDSSTSSASASSSTISIPRPDELFLGPPPMTVPSMNPASLTSSDLYYPPPPQPQFAFNPPPSAGAAGSSWDDSPNPPTLSLSSSTGDSESSPDLAGRYRSNVLLRNGMLPQGGAGLLQGFYGSQASTTGDQWSFPGDFGLGQNPYLNSLQGHHQHPQQQQHQLHQLNTDFGAGGIDVSVDEGIYGGLNGRRGSIDGYSDGGSHSAANSAASSSVHLPLEFGDQTQTQQQQQQSSTLDYEAFQQRATTGAIVGRNDINEINDIHNVDTDEGNDSAGREGNLQRPPPSRDGGRFSSAFGLLSLADGEGSYVAGRGLGAGEGGLGGGGEHGHEHGNGGGGEHENGLGGGGSGLGRGEGGAPFFSHSAMKLPPQDSTPRPYRDGQFSGVGSGIGAGGGLLGSSPLSGSGLGGGGSRERERERDREAEMRELRDFWKQYLRTPLSGPPSLGQTPKAEFINGFHGSFLGGSGGSGGGGATATAMGKDSPRPGIKRSLSRVVSLPSVRTPLEEKVGGVLQGQGQGQQQQVVHHLYLHQHQHPHDLQHHQPQHQNQAIYHNMPPTPGAGAGIGPGGGIGVGGGGMRSSTTVPDDLRSYEQAVLARKAPTFLRFPPRRGRLSNASVESDGGGGRGGPGPNSASPISSPVVGQQQQPMILHHRQQLAQQQQQQQQQALRSAFELTGRNGLFVDSFGPLLSSASNGGGGGNSSDEAASVVSSSSAGNGGGSVGSSSMANTTGTNGTNGSVSVGRPNFKRLPSQTLENAVQKRALFRWGGGMGGGEDCFEDTTDDSEADVAGQQHQQTQLPNSYHQQHQHQQQNPYQTHQQQGYQSRTTVTMQPPPSSYSPSIPPGPGQTANETLLDRFRRQSMPAALSGLGSLGSGIGVGAGPGPGPVGVGVGGNSPSNAGVGIGLGSGGGNVDRSVNGSIPPPPRPHSTQQMQGQMHADSPALSVGSGGES